MSPSATQSMPQRTTTARPSSGGKEPEAAARLRRRDLRIAAAVEASWLAALR